MKRLNSIKGLPNATFVPIPEGVGNAIPTNAQDLLKFIKQQQQNQQQQSMQNVKLAPEQYHLDVTQERWKKIDEERALLEERLMLQEDILSSQLSKLFQEYDKERFRLKIFKQVEEREKQEKKEREERLKAAEERRKQVVLRLQRQQEEEIRKQQALQLQLQAIEEEKLRMIEYEKQQIHFSNIQMQYEEKLSQLVEQDYRDYLINEKKNNENND
jgi:hypothetical protein